MLSFANVFAFPWLRTSSFTARSSRLAAITKSDCRQMMPFQFGRTLYYMSQTTPKSLIIFSSEPGNTKQCEVCGCVYIVRGKAYFCRESLGGCGNHTFRDGAAALRALIAEALRWNSMRCVCLRKAAPASHALPFLAARRTSRTVSCCRRRRAAAADGAHAPWGITLHDPPCQHHRQKQKCVPPPRCYSRPTRDAPATLQNSVLDPPLLPLSRVLLIIWPTLHARHLTANRKLPEVRVPSCTVVARVQSEATLWQGRRNRCAKLALTLAP